MQQPDVTRALASFAARLALGEVPEPVRDKACLHILDSIGCGIAGAATGLAGQARRFITLEHSPGGCALLGGSWRFPPAASAFANAVAINALDFDDGFEIDGKGMGHPGATIVAAALSACFATTVSGADFLAAVLAAYEVSNRIVRSQQPSTERFQQVYGVCQHQVVGAAVAFGRLSGLDAAGLENAIGLAGILANVPSLQKYNWDARPLVSLKDCNAPAAETGVRAVQMHHCGMVGARDVLGGETGLWRMLGSDRFDAASLTSDLGREWTMLQNSIKLYPTCRWMHPAIEAFATVLATEGWSGAAIEQVIVHTSAALVRHFMDWAPATIVDAEFSLPFALASIALGRAPAARWYDPEALADPAIRAFARRVRAEVDPEIDALMSGPSRRPTARVTVTAAGRTVASALVAYPAGGAERPLPAGAVEAKFLANAAPVIGEARTRTLRDAILHLWLERDMAELIALTAGNGLVEVRPAATPGA